MSKQYNNINIDTVMKKLWSKLPISQKKKQQIMQKIDAKFTYIPQIGIFGKTGVGKSSLCNALFGRNIASVDDVKACTREQQKVDLQLGHKNGVQVIDVPGVGENEKRDEEYATLYAELMPTLDAIFWLLKADDRAFSTDETFYKTLVKPLLDQGKPFFIILNQVDKIEPFREWNEQENRPGVNQQKTIEQKIAYVAQQFNIDSDKIIPISANEKYNLDVLLDKVIDALPSAQKVIVYNDSLEENRTEHSHQEAQSGFFETIIETVDSVVQSVFSAVDDFFDWLF